MARARLRRDLFLVFLALLTSAVAGCGGDDGDRGPQGEQGPPGPPPVFGTRTVAPEQLIPQITNVDVSSPMVVNFQVTDERGFGVAGIENGVSFTVNKLLPATTTETSVWKTYFLSDDEGTANAQAGTYAGGTLQDHGNGTYTFTFDQDLEDIDGVAFEPTRTHRVGVELRDVNLLGEALDGSGNGVFDFQPSTGNTSGIERREIVKNESCATCHGGPVPFNFHGGPRNDVEYCVTCHQPGSIDVRATAGLQPITIDFRVMIHKIHAATADAQWCGFGCEASFIGGGPGTPLDDFSDVVHPQDVRNCTTCHDDSDPDTPQASNVFNSPTAEVCASCHTDLDFNDTGLTNLNGNHDPGPASNADCVTCHADGGIAPDKIVRVAHQIPEKLAAARFEYNIVSVSQTMPTQSPLITFSVTDPTNGDAPYDLVNDDAFTGSGARFVMDIAWPTSDYTNAGTADNLVAAPSRPFEINLLQGVGTKITDNGDGTYTVDASVDTSGSGGEPAFAIPGTATGSGAVGIEGHMAGDFDDPATEGVDEEDGVFDQEVPVTSAVAFFAITDGSPSARRSVVDIEKCQNCHGENDGLALHGGNRVDNIDLCVTCHNPNATDLAQRPTDPDGIVNGANTAAPDGLEERTIDFKYMIHAIHGSEVRTIDYQVRGFFNSDHDYGDTHIPRSVAGCLMCHEEGTFEIASGADIYSALGTTVATQSTVASANNFGADDADLVNSAAAHDPSDDDNLSPVAGTCSSCHDSADALDHMDTAGTGGTSFGDGYVGGFAVTTGSTALQSALTTENCAFCHGPGAIVDVAEIHAAAGGE